MRILPEHIYDDGIIKGLCEGDSTITGFSYRDGGPFSVDIRRVDGSFGRLTLLHVTQLGFCGLQNGSIVFWFKAWHPIDVPEEQSAHNQGAWAVLFGNDIPVYDLAPAIKRVQETADPTSYLVYMESSYGGLFSVLCGAIEIE